MTKEIQTSRQDSSIWIDVDETTDACGPYVHNVHFGKLDNENYNPPFLVNCAFLDKPDSSSIARLVNDSIRALWPNFDTSLLKLLSDTAAYMLKAGKYLKDSRDLTCSCSAQSLRGRKEDVPGGQCPDIVCEGLPQGPEPCGYLERNVP